MKIIITGGSGFIGTALTQKLLQQNHEVCVLDRMPPKITNPKLTHITTDFSPGTVPNEVCDADAIIHLAGASIFSKWTQEHKHAILQSRVEPIKEMLALCTAQGRAPKVFVSASAIGWYGYTHEVRDEASLHGSGFLAEVCSAWEQEAHTFEQVGSRVVSVRTAIVLGPGGGMMKSALPPFKLGLGGTFGKGDQWFSWIHIDDLVSVYIQALTDATISGPINAAAPEPVTSAQFTKTLATVLHRPALFRIPAFALKLALGEFATAVLGSQRIIPAKLQQLGFVYAYPTLKGALEKCVG